MIKDDHKESDLHRPGIKAELPVFRKLEPIMIFLSQFNNFGANLLIGSCQREPWVCIVLHGSCFDHHQILM
jgi:hypothetical protein